jgi:hypothetical protein
MVHMVTQEAIPTVAIDDGGPGSILLVVNDLDEYAAKCQGSADREAGTLDTGMRSITLNLSPATKGAGDAQRRADVAFYGESGSMALDPPPPHREAD